MGLSQNSKILDCLKQWFRFRKCGLEPPGGPQRYLREPTSDVYLIDHN